MPEGLEDICHVYDGTCLGFNASCFWMPNAASAVRVVSFYTYVFDSDFGEYFLNFFNTPDIRLYCGVDVPPFYDKIKACRDLVTGYPLERWN